MSEAHAARFVIGPDSRPAFTRYARLHEDRARVANGHSRARARL